EHADVEQCREEEARSGRQAEQRTQDMRSEHCELAEMVDESQRMPAEILHQTDERHRQTLPAATSTRRSGRSSGPPPPTKALTRASLLARSSAGEPSTGPSGKSSTTRSAMRIVEVT